MNLSWKCGTSTYWFLTDDTYHIVAHVFLGMHGMWQCEFDDSDAPLKGARFEQLEDAKNYCEVTVKLCGT